MWRTTQRLNTAMNTITAATMSEESAAAVGSFSVYTLV
jgi:hypothetical protein